MSDGILFSSVFNYDYKIHRIISEIQLLRTRLLGRQLIIKIDSNNDREVDLCGSIVAMEFLDCEKVLKKQICDEDCCPICIAKFEDPHGLIPCKHIFCKECISSWINEKKRMFIDEYQEFTCPMCREFFIKSRDLIKIFI